MDQPQVEEVVEDDVEELRYSPPPPYNTEYHQAHRAHHSYSRKSYESDKDRIEVRIQCPSIASLRWCLKLYCLVFGGLGTILSVLWVVFHFYVLGETDSIDLRIQRYLDIGLGIVLFLSTVSLIYGGYADSKNWLVVYTTGSMSVIILYWSWAVYTSYVQLEQPAYSDEVENLVILLTFLYLLLLIPILLYYRALLNNSTEPENRHCCEEVGKDVMSSPKLEKV